MGSNFWVRIARPAGLCRLAFLALAATGMVMASWMTMSSPVLADNSLEFQKGGLFHRKGWVSPEIHRKASSTKPSATGTTTKTAAKRQSKRSTTRRRRSSAKRAHQVRLRARTRRKRRIPARIVRRRERKISRAARVKAKISKKKPIQVASLGNVVPLPTPSAQKRKVSITGGAARVQWVARSSCVPARLKAAINYVARNYGRVRVNSTCRSKRHNRRVGGARNSWHLKSRAADIRVFGNIRAAARYLRRVVGGYKHYGGGLFHIDTGPKRSW